MKAGYLVAVSKDVIMQLPGFASAVETRISSLGLVELKPGGVGVSARPWLLIPFSRCCGASSSLRIAGVSKLVCA